MCINDLCWVYSDNEFPDKLMHLQVCCGYSLFTRAGYQQKETYQILLYYHMSDLFVLRFYGPVNPMGSC